MELGARAAVYVETTACHGGQTSAVRSVGERGNLRFAVFCLSRLVKKRTFVV